MAGRGRPRLPRQVEREFWRQIALGLSTEDAASIIRQAAATVSAGHMVKIDVTGHTDTVGSVKYNQKLSERRAAAVKAEMIKDGVSADAISTVGVGKSGLLVPTPDGVREPQNRRAEIELK